MFNRTISGTRLTDRAFQAEWLVGKGKAGSRDVTAHGNSTQLRKATIGHYSSDHRYEKAKVSNAPKPNKHEEHQRSSSITTSGKENSVDHPLCFSMGI